MAQDLGPALGCRSLALLGKGMPKRFMAIHGRKLQEEKFLSPMMRV
jgi:hypothetical protein